MFVCRRRRLGGIGAGVEGQGAPGRYAAGQAAMRVSVGRPQETPAAAGTARAFCISGARRLARRVARCAQDAAERSGGRRRRRLCAPSAAGQCRGRRRWSAERSGRALQWPGARAPSANGTAGARRRASASAQAQRRCDASGCTGALPGREWAWLPGSMRRQPGSRAAVAARADTGPRLRNSKVRTLDLRVGPAAVSIVIASPTSAVRWRPGGGANGAARGRDERG